MTTTPTAETAPSTTKSSHKNETTTNNSDNTEDTSTSTTTTSPQEIARQHQQAMDRLDRNLYQQPSCIRAVEIPLTAKDASLVQHMKEQEQEPQDTTNDRLNMNEACSKAWTHRNFPIWASRGHVDVTGWQDLLRLGYNTTTTAATTKTSSSSTSTTKDTAVNNLWDPVTARKHNVRLCRPSHDTWGIGKVVFLFCDDFLQNKFVFPYYQHIQNVLLPPILNVLGIDESQIVRLLAASLPPGVTIPTHFDTGAWVPHTHRVHIPILVQDPSRIVFTCGLSNDDDTDTNNHDKETSKTIRGMERIDCTPGHVFEINNQCLHAVSNCDTDHRVHLILDYMDKSTINTPQWPCPRTVQLQPGEVVWQTRRSVDRQVDQGRRPTPTYFVLGAQKAGTTSLYEYLNQHPLVIRARRRETHCLDWRWNDKLKTPKAQRDWCHKFYYAEELERHPSCLTGDSTPSYLLDSRRVIPRLQSVFCRHYDQAQPWQETDGIRFFVLLRNPIRRAESHYAMVTSKDGSPAQLKTRGSEWRDKSMSQVILDELKELNACGLIPYFDVATGTVDQTVFDDFSGSDAENQAWDRYLATLPLNTGSYGLLTRGLYELNLRPWFAAFAPSRFLILHLESMTGNLPDTMSRVWDHLNLPPFDIEDETPQNQRSYQPSLSEEWTAYLHRFYAPHNRRLQRVLMDIKRSCDGNWTCAAWDNTN